MAEPRKEPREPRIPKESAPFDADGRWTRTWIMYFESLFDLSVKEAVRESGTVTHTDGDLTLDMPVFGNGKDDVKVGTKSGNTNEVATVSGAIVTGNTVEWDADGNLIDAGVAPGGGGGGGGTVTHTGGALTADLPVFGAGSDDIKVGTKTGNTNKLVSNTGTNVTGNTVKWDANGNLIDAGGTPGTGTVTSVALTVPAEFSVSGSPVTTSGTLAVSKATQSANTVYAGPTTGSAAAPTFRAVVPADLPLASSSAFGAVKVDGTTITASSGVISAAGGSSGALVLLEQHTASSSATLDFTAWYFSAYDEYVIEIVNLLPNTNNIQALLTVSTDGGSTWSSTTYYARLFYFFGTLSGLVNGATSSWPVTGTTLSSDSHYGAIGTLKLFSPGSSALYKLLTGDVLYFDGTNDIIKVSVSARWSTATAVNALRFAPSSGNWTSGTIRIYGVAK